MSLKFSALHKWRRTVQVGFGIFITNGYIPVIWTKMLYSGPLRSVCVPVLNCHSCPTALFACPIGMLQHFSAIHQFPYLILGILGFVGLVFGRAACGWLCPFGLVQDLMFKIKSVKLKLPKPFSYLKYVSLLLLVFILPYFTEVHWFSRLCPWGGIQAAIPWVVWNPAHPLTGLPAVSQDAIGYWFSLKMVIVAGFLILFVVIKRPFCTTTCPLGAIFSFFNKISLLKFDVDKDCSECDRCSWNCVVDKPAYEGVDDNNCVGCLECSACNNVNVHFNLDNRKVPETTAGVPCQVDCPVGTEAWRYIAHIQHGEYEAAYKSIREPNPFPSVCARVCNNPCEFRCPVSNDGGDPIAIRSLKRFITDQIDPSVYLPPRLGESDNNKSGIAIIGAGPAGLTAAHFLSLKGYRVTVFESESVAGGMLLSGIPEFRLPRSILEKEINRLLNENITIKYNQTLDKNFTIDDLFTNGFKAVFLAIGAHKSRRLLLENEDSIGIYPSLQFLKDFNLKAENRAFGKVIVFGGGNSALDSARVAVRQKDVESVKLFYRRSREEMPAFAAEIEAAIEEGLIIETLISPMKFFTKNGRILKVGCIRNRLSDYDSSGRKKPVPIPGSEFTTEADTIITAIGEQPDLSNIFFSGIKLSVKGTFKTDQNMMISAIPGVFAGGDLVTGPNTAVDAIAAGKKAAVNIDYYIQGKKLSRVLLEELPKVHIKPGPENNQDSVQPRRIEAPTSDIPSRAKSLEEVELPYSEKDAAKEANRCMRCDLKYT